jgi:hypothetical protein
MNDYTDLIREILSHRGYYGKSSGSICIDEVYGMNWSYNKGYYEDTQSKEVATAVLEAYASGVDFNTLLKKNKQVREYWHQIQSEKVNKEKAREREIERRRKLDEKRAIEQAQKEEVMAKLTPEELEAFGFTKKLIKAKLRKVTK